MSIVVLVLLPVYLHRRGKRASQEEAQLSLKREVRHDGERREHLLDDLGVVVGQAGDIGQGVTDVALDERVARVVGDGRENLSIAAGY